jgi:hypothetical protein
MSVPGIGQAEHPAMRSPDMKIEIHRDSALRQLCDKSVEACKGLGRELLAVGRPQSGRPGLRIHVVQPHAVYAEGGQSRCDGASLLRRWQIAGKGAINSPEANAVRAAPEVAASHDDSRTVRRNGRRRPKPNRRRFDACRDYERSPPWFGSRGNCRAQRRQ